MECPNEDGIDSDPVQNIQNDDAPHLTDPGETVPKTIDDKYDVVDEPRPKRKAAQDATMKIRNLIPLI